MALRLHLADGTAVESDSPQELVDFYHRVASNGHKATTKLEKTSATKRQSGSGEPLRENAAKFIRLLYDKPEGLTTKELADSFGFDPRGLGGIVANLSTWAKKNGMRGKKDVLAKNRRPENGVKVRTVTLTKEFRQRVKEGKVSGLDLDQ
jgi:hypothetical protein